MTTRTTKRTPGAPTWMDLATPDLDGAKAFYNTVFGWDYMDTGPDFGHYQMALAQGHNAAGIGPLQPGSPMPSAWTIYFATDDADADVARVKLLGGQVIVDPMEIPGSGRMAICVDPTGAVFGLWQTINMIGAGIENEHGAMSWHEVNTPDSAAARAFYGELFGLTPQPMEGMDYYIMQQGMDMICGILQMDENWEGIPPHWMGYFTVDDTDAALDRVVAAGGEVKAPAFDMPYGRMAVIADPFGAIVSIVKPPAVPV
jgi:predicted enzyme related to lactoylglutathione lyase